MTEDQKQLGRTLWNIADQLRGAMNADDFARITLRCPSKLKQKRIADCLSSVDGRITVESVKLESLKTHKKGLMQQLFASVDEAIE